MIALPWEIEACPRDIQAHYTKMIENGQTENFAIMICLQQPPGTSGTDRTFMEGKMAGGWIDELPKFQAKWLIKEAKAAGINPAGKFYMSGLADKRGHTDPEAWVSGVDDVKRVALKRGLSVRGAINIEGPEVLPPKRVALAKDIERELVKEETKRSPGLPKRDVVERVRQKNAPRWKRKST